MGKTKNALKMEQPSSFAEGIRQMDTKKAFYIPVNLTKARARILMGLINEHRLETAQRYEKEGDESDWCAALQWLANQVSKRWSQNDLYNDYPKKRKNKNAELE